jgi:ribose transport system permease protein
VRATGGNIVAAKFSGINTDKIIIQAMIISGFLAAISGLMMVARINAGRPEAGGDLALDAVTAVILGGTSLFGGKGSVVKTLIGALIITSITNALVIFGFQINVQMIVKGLIVIAAVSISEKQR